MLLPEKGKLGVAKRKFSILFVCLGNICRSPIAEGVFRHLVSGRGLEDKFEVDSCGTGHWHEGQPPHQDSRKVAKKNGISLEGQIARQVTDEDFEQFDLLVAMDTSNLNDLKRMRGESKASIICLREYDHEEKDLDVPDPYYGGPKGFDNVFNIINRCCVQLLDELEETIKR